MGKNCILHSLHVTKGVMNNFSCFRKQSSDSYINGQLCDFFNKKLNCSRDSPACVVAAVGNGELFAVASPLPTGAYGSYTQARDQIQCTDKKSKFSSYISGAVTKSCRTTYIWGNICEVPHILESLSLRRTSIHGEQVIRFGALKPSHKSGRSKRSSIK